MEHQNFNVVLPLEILTIIFSFLPRRDRFICMCMCPRWKEAMNASSLWRHMSVKLDVDFFEISTIQLTIQYCCYIKSLELQFENPEEPLQWINYKMMDVTKRIYRFLSIFVNKNLQINKLSLNKFSDFYKFKKIFYYLSMFLRSQYKIKIISCNGSYFSKKALIKILTCSVVANHSSIECLDIQNSYNESGQSQTRMMDYDLLSNQLMICLMAMKNLTLFKIDLMSLICNNVLNGILNGCFDALRYLDIRIADNDIPYINRSGACSCNTWIDLRKKYPKLKVSLVFYDIESEYDLIEEFLVSSMPLNYVSWINNSVYLKTLYELTLQKYSSLEVVKIDAKRLCIDDLVIFAACHCRRLKRLQFSGIIKDSRNVQNKFKRFSFSGFTRYDSYLRNTGVCKCEVLNERVYKVDETLCTRSYI